ncbi:MAG: tyrosine recombinase [Anaerolineae bacterium]
MDELEQSLNQFLQHLADERQYSENTIAAYRNDLKQLLRFLCKAEPAQPGVWADVTAFMVETYVSFLHQRDYAPSTVARKIAAVKSFFSYLHYTRAIRANPAAQLDSPKVQKNLPKALSADDIARLLSAPTRASGPKAIRDRAILELLYATGMRVTELVSLAVDDLDLEQGTVTCHSAAGQRRKMPIGDGAMETLANYITSGRALLVKDAAERALFVNHRGQKLTRQGLWLIIKGYAQEANLEVEVTPYILRHSFAAHLLHSGADLHEVQERLGHANISTTQVYTQVADEP